MAHMAMPKLCRHHASISGEMCYMLQAESPTSKKEALTPPTIMLAAKESRESQEGSASCDRPSKERCRRRNVEIVSASERERQLVDKVRAAYNITHIGF
jgi:hypothetical protein